LVQKQKREKQSHNLLKNKNLRVSSLSTTWTGRSDDDNSPYSCRDKVSGNTLQAPGLEIAPQQQETNEKR